MKIPQDTRGVDVNPRGHAPRPMGRAEVAGSTTETIRESRYGDGQTRHGTNPDEVHTTARRARYKDGEQHRADTGSSAYPK